jgi:hypothetical protein
MNKEQRDVLLFYHTAEYMKGFSDCEDAVRVELGGDKVSELWGEYGLLAATMKAVKALHEQEGHEGKESRNVLGFVKTAADLVGCQSWLVARLSLQELRHRLDELAKMIEEGSK